MTYSYSLVDVRPLSSSIGAEIHGIDLKQFLKSNL